MSSHQEYKVNTQFLHWLNKLYGGHGEVKATRGLKHDYLGMTLDFSQPGKVVVDMVDYINNMVNEFDNFTPDDTAATPAGVELLSAGKGQLDQPLIDKFRTFVAKGLFACKQAQPNTHNNLNSVHTG